MLLSLLDSFIERELAILLGRDAIAAGRHEVLVTQAGRNALDGIQAIDTVAHAHLFTFGGTQEEFFDVFRHPAALLRTNIGSAYPGQVYL